MISGDCNNGEDERPTRGHCQHENARSVWILIQSFRHF
jgi:hypothetical protein